MYIYIYADHFTVAVLIHSTEFPPDRLMSFVGARLNPATLAYTWYNQKPVAAANSPESLWLSKVNDYNISRSTKCMHVQFLPSKYRVGWAEHSCSTKVNNVVCELKPRGSP